MRLASSASASITARLRSSPGVHTAARPSPDQNAVRRMRIPLARRSAGCALSGWPVERPRLVAPDAGDPLLLTSLILALGALSVHSPGGARCGRSTSPRRRGGPRARAARRTPRRRRRGRRAAPRPAPVRVRVRVTVMISEGHGLRRRLSSGEIQEVTIGHIRKPKKT